MSSSLRVNLPVRRLNSAALLVGLVAVGRVEAQRALNGRVVDSLNSPIQFAHVAITGTNLATVTDREGRFRIRVPQAGRTTVLVRRLGYRPEQHVFDIKGDSAVDAPFTLLPAPVELAAMTTAAARTLRLDRAGFYERMVDASKGLLTGTFIGPEEIEARHPSSVLNMLEGRMGVSLMKKKIMSANGSCEMMVYVDGHLVDGVDHGTGTTRLMRDHILMQRVGSTSREPPPSTSPVEETAPPSDVAGIEIYPRAVNAPPGFQRLAGSCGVVLIWTK